MPDHDAHDIIVLFSGRSRDAYAAEATALGETYTFTDAWGLPRTWVKGEYAYLAPNAAGLLLARCNLKHHLVEEAALDAARLARCRALLIANAGHLAPETIARIDAWLADGDRRLIVSGKTNLPPRLLGLHSCEPAPVQGYSGWRWRAGSPFAGDAWEQRYVSGYKGHPAHRIVPAKGSRVLADLVELSGDLSDATTATVGELGPAIVLTDKTVYIANQVFELLGGMMQAHLNVEAVRHWANATHWGDTLLFFLRQLMREVGLSSLWQTRLRSFGTYDGVLSFRHDVHGMRDFSFLDYQIQNLIPASYDIEDPTFSTNIDEAMARDWSGAPRSTASLSRLHNEARSAIRRQHLRQWPFEHVRRAKSSHHHLHLGPIPAATFIPTIYAMVTSTPGHAHPLRALLLLPHDRIRRARSQRHGGRHDRREAAHLRHRRAAHHRHLGHLVPLPPGRHDDRGMAQAARLRPHARVRRRLRTGRDHLRRP